MQIAIYGRKFGNQFAPYAESLLNQLIIRNIKFSIFESFFNFMRDEAGLNPQPYKLFNSHKDLDKNSNFVFSIGGDGTILETVTIVRDTGIPVLGINSGRLGFLANISKDDIDMTVDALLSEKYTIEKRSLLELHSPIGIFKDWPFALNEFTIQKKDYEMITIQVWLNDLFLNSYWTDGIIISTPTGSTAYSLSVGGPLLTSDTRGLIISPIAPHNLTVRPIVIPDNKVIRLKVKSRTRKFLLSMDYQSVIVNSENEIVLKRSDFDTPFVRFEHQDFYTTLRNKLMWGADKRN